MAGGRGAAGAATALADAADRLDPVQARHQVIHQDHAVRQAGILGLRQRGQACFARGHGVGAHAQAAQHVGQRGARAGAVVHHQRTHARQGGMARGHGALAIGEAERSREGEAAAGARRAGGGDAAAHQLDQLARDRQAQAAAAVLAGGRAVGLGEGLEQAPDLLRAHADAGVGHREFERHAAVVALQQFDRHDDFAALGELDGVAGEVDQHLSQAQRVAHQLLRHPGADPIHQFHALGVASHADDARQVLEHLVQVEGQLLDRQLAGFHPGVVEDIVDQAQQVLAGAQDPGQVVAQPGRRLAHQGQAAHADDGVHRGADLMAHVGQELRFHARFRFGAQHGLLGRLAAQADHAHEHQHVDGDAQLQRVQGPEVGRQDARRQLGLHHGAAGAEEPAEQEVESDLVAGAHAAPGAGQAEEHRRGADRHGEHDQDAVVEQAQAPQHAGQDAQCGAALHDAAEAPVHARARQDLFDEQVGAGGGDLRGQPHHVLAEPLVAAPQELLAEAEPDQAVQGQAAHVHRVLAIQLLAQAEPLTEAVGDQAEGDAEQQALQHLLAQRGALVGVRLHDADRGHARPPGEHPHQQRVVGARLEPEGDGRDPALERAILGQAASAAGELAQAAAVFQVELDLVEDAEVDLHHPVVRRARRHPQGDAHPVRILDQLEDAASGVRPGVTVGGGQRRGGVELVAFVDQHRGGRPGIDAARVRPEHQRFAPRCVDTLGEQHQHQGRQRRDGEQHEAAPGHAGGAEQDGRSGHAGAQREGRRVHSVALHSGSSEWFTKKKGRTRVRPFLRNAGRDAGRRCAARSGWSCRSCR